MVTEVTSNKRIEIEDLDPCYQSVIPVAANAVSTEIPIRTPKVPGGPDYFFRSMDWNLGDMG